MRSALLVSRLQCIVSFRVLCRGVNYCNRYHGDPFIGRLCRQEPGLYRGFRQQRVPALLSPCHRDEALTYIVTHIVTHTVIYIVRHIVTYIVIYISFITPSHHQSGVSCGVDLPTRYRGYRGAE